MEVWKFGEVVLNIMFIALIDRSCERLRVVLYLMFMTLIDGSCERLRVGEQGLAYQS